MVDLPAPERPTSATVLPPGTVSEKFSDGWRAGGRAVGEADVVEDDGAVFDRKRPRARPIDDGRLLVEQLVDAVGGGQALQRRGRDIAQRLDRLRRQQQRGDEPHEIADRADAAGDAPVGEGDDAGDGQPAKRLQQRARAGARARTAFMRSWKTCSKFSLTRRAA